MRHANLIILLLLSAAASVLPTAAVIGIAEVLPGSHLPCCGPITPAGLKLAQTLDSMHVESLWLANQHINWETGKPDRGATDEGPGNHTHCSAFAASAAKRLGVYLLHPPEHGQELLSNAQAQWMTTPEARKAGWRTIPQSRVPSMGQAQKLANQGNLVIVLYQNPDPHRPGHIAIVRPSEKSQQSLEENGPETIQAGQHNFVKTTVRAGFKNHPGAWPSGVRYYYHPLP